MKRILFAFLIIIGVLFSVSVVNASWSVNGASCSYRADLNITAPVALQDQNASFRTQISDINGNGYIRNIANTTSADYNKTGNGTDSNYWTNYSSSIFSLTSANTYSGFYFYGCDINYTQAGTVKVLPAQSGQTSDNGSAIEHFENTSKATSSSGMTFTSVDANHIYGNYGVMFIGNTSYAVFPASMINDSNAVEFWWKPNAYATTNAVYVFSRNGDDFSLLTQPDATLYVHIAGTGDFGTTETIVADTWYHIVVSSGALGLKLWVNGALWGSSATTLGAQSATGDLYLGNYSLIPIYGNIGTIDEMRLSKVQVGGSNGVGLTQSNIQTNGNQPIGALSNFGQSSSSITANFTSYFEPYTILDPENGVSTIYLDVNNTSTATGTTITSYSWRDNGVVFSVLANASKAFSGAGDHNISLLVSDGSLYAQKDSNIQVKEYPQGVNFSWSVSPTTGLNVVFTGSSSISVDKNYWMIDNAYVGIGNPLNNVFGVAGDYNVNYVVHNVYDLNRAKNQIVSVSDIDANFGLSGNTILDPENGVSSVLISFTDSTIFNNASLTHGFAWKQDGVNFAFTQNVNKSYSVPGIYTICLDVNAYNSQGAFYSDSNCKTLSITQYPQALTFSWNITNPIKDTNVLFTATATDVNGIRDWNYGYASDGNSLGNPNYHKFSSSGNKLVCLTATNNVGLSKVKCLTVPVYGFFRVNFYDENTSSALIPTTLIFDGNNYVSLLSGNYLDLNLFGFVSKNYSLVFGDSNHYSRTVSFDLNAFSNQDFNALLLNTSKGQSIVFVFANDLKVFGVAYVQVWKNDSNVVNNITNRIKTNSSGGATIFLNPNDANYSFRIWASDGNIYDYNGVGVNILVPKDEISLMVLDANTWNLTIQRLGAHIIQNITGNLNVIILPFTYSQYGFKIDYNVQYYSRSYGVRSGNGDSQVLQPYLISTALGSSVVFQVYNAYSKVALPNILIVVKKNLPSLGYTIVESHYTGIDGRSIFYLQAGGYYDDISYYSNETELKLSGSLDISSTAITAYLDVSDSNITIPSNYNVIFSVSPPDGNVLYLNLDGNVHLSGSIVSSQLMSYASVLVYACDVLDANYSGPISSNTISYSFDLNLTGTPSYCFVKLILTAINSTGTQSKTVNYSVVSYGSVSIIDNLRSGVADFGLLGQILIAVFGTLFILLAISMNFGVGGDQLFFVGMLVMGIFAFIFWFNNPLMLMVYAIMVIGGMFVYMRGRM